MFGQTRRGSLRESFQNLAIGFAINAIASWCGIHALDVRSTTGFAIFVTGMSFVSVARSYGLRRYNEWQRRRRQLPDFEYIIDEIAAERRKAIEARGYTTAIDDAKINRELAEMASGYAFLASSSDRERDRRNLVKYGNMPILRGVFQTDPRDELIRCCGLAIAEIGRIDRAEKRARQ